jgi:hypothetical protein
MPHSGGNGCGPGRRPAGSGLDGHRRERGAVGGRAGRVLPPGGDGPSGGPPGRDRCSRAGRPGLFAGGVICVDRNFSGYDLITRS